MADSEPRIQQSQVTLKTAYTVCFAGLSVVALAVLVVKTQVALTLTGLAALLALALQHLVVGLRRRGLKRGLAIGVVVAVPVAAAGQIVVGELLQLRRERQQG